MRSMLYKEQDYVMEILHLPETQQLRIQLNGTLADGSLKRFRQKFAEGIQHAVAQRLIDELLDGSLYRGDWTKGEIEITGIVRIISNRFWTEVEYSVLFPPKHAGGKPNKGTYRNILWNSGEMAGSGGLAIGRDGKIALLKSFRHAVRRWCLEIPIGVKHQEESAEKCALREMREEVGARPTDETQIIHLGHHDTDTGIIRQQLPLFAVTNMEFGTSHRDASESALTRVMMTPREILDAIARDEITDSRVKGCLISAFARGVITF